MIVQYTIKSEMYDSQKWGVPISIIAKVDLPLKDFYESEDKVSKVDELCVKFILENENEMIKEHLHVLKSVMTDKIPYNYTILSYADNVGNAFQDGIIAIHVSPGIPEMKRRLTANDVLPVDAAKAVSDDGVCDCCQLSDNIYDALVMFQQETDINCPWCGGTISVGNIYPQAVQEANYYMPNHHIGMYPTMRCPHCGEHVSLIPTKINYNANHDVYYTGGASYMADDFKEGSAASEIREIFDKRLWPTINQYIRRKLNPEDRMDEMLNEGNVHLWAERDFTAAICEFFYKHGLKE